MNYVDLTGGRWVPLSESKRLDTATEPKAVIDMADELVVETPDEISDAVQELIAEAFVDEDDSELAHPLIRSQASSSA